MSTVISTLKAMVVVDTSGLAEGLTLTKKELKDVGKVADELRTPWQKFRGEVDQLQRYLAAGKIEYPQYIRGVRDLVQEFSEGVPVVGKLTSLLSPMNAALAAGGITAAAATATLAAAVGTAYAATSKAVEIVDRRIGSIDELGDTAARLDVPISALSRLSEAAKLGDVNQESVLGGFRKLQVELGKAAGGSEESAKKFDDLGLSVESLMEMRPDQQFAAVAEAIGRLPTTAEKFAAINEVFGKGNTDLAGIVGNMDELLAAASATGAVVSDQLGESVGKVDDASKQLAATWQGFENTLTALVAGPLAFAIESATWLLNNRQALKDMTSGVDNLVTGATMMIPLPGSTLLAGAARAESKIGREGLIDAIFDERDALMEQANATAAVSAAQNLARAMAAAVADETTGLSNKTVGLTQEQFKQIEAAEKYLETLQQELYALTATAEQRERMKAGAAGMTEQEQNVAAALRQQIEELKTLKQLDDELAGLRESRGETAERKAIEAGMTAEQAARIRARVEEIEAVKKLGDELKKAAEDERRLVETIKEGTKSKQELAAGKVREAMGLALEGKITPEELERFIAKEAKGLMGGGKPQFGAPSDAVKGSAKAQEIVLRQDERRVEIDLMRSMEGHLRALAEKPSGIVVEEISAP